MSSPKPLTILVYAMDGAGHLNAAVGMAQALAARGHTIKFLLNEIYTGQFANFGFEEIALKRTTPKAADDSTPDRVDKANPFKHLGDKLQKAGMIGGERLSPIEKLKADAKKQGPPPAFMDDMVQDLIDFDPQLERLIKEQKADVFILDHFFVPPALPRSDIPWLYLFSGNPVNLYGSDKLPPFGSGFASNSDPETWKEYLELAGKKFGFMQGGQKKLDAARGYEPPEPAEKESNSSRVLKVSSPYLNIYGFPKELDYDDIVPRPAKLTGVDAFMRDVPDRFQLPEGFWTPGEKLIYVSLGSMGSADVELMKKITGILADSPHKFIVSKGPRAEEFELPANSWGEAYLPQTRILPLVDLVITHGGNNTITETFSSGKPQIVLPLFGDQQDNGQRIQEKGYGINLETHKFTPEELIAAVDKLLADKEVQARCQAAAKRIASSNSKEEVSIQIENLVQENKQQHQ